jgi:VanZ family protein
MLVDVFVVNIRMDHLLHAILYIPWVLLYLMTFRPIKANEKIIMIGVGLLMAFITEGIQYFLSYRSYNINDMLSNFIGLILGTGVLFTGILFQSEK